MKIKTSDLEGSALDWAVAKALGENNHIESRFVDNDKGQAEIVCWCSREYSQDWVYGGPLIESHEMEIERINGCSEPWVAFARLDHPGETGRTLLIAAMRVIVSIKLGETVDIPKELA